MQLHSAVCEQDKTLREKYAAENKAFRQLILKSKMGIYHTGFVEATSLPHYILVDTLLGCT